MCLSGHLSRTVLCDCDFSPHYSHSAIHSQMYSYRTFTTAVKTKWMKLNEVNMRENLRMGNHFSVFPSTQIFIHINSSRDENQMKMKYWFPKEINIFLFSHTQPPIPFIISAKYFPADYLHYDGNGKSMQLEIKILYFYFGIFLSPVLFDNNC